MSSSSPVSDHKDIPHLGFWNWWHGLKPSKAILQSNGKITTVLWPWKTSVKVGKFSYCLLHNYRGIKK